MIYLIFIDILLLLDVEDKIDMTMNTMKIMTYTIEDLGEVANKLFEDMKNKISDQDAKLVGGLILHLISTHLSGSHNTLDILRACLAFIF